METAEARTPTTGQVFAMELQQEATTTRRLIERLPTEKFGWQPHEKSMTLGRLANHVVEMLDWTAVTILEDELDFEQMAPAPQSETTEELLTRLDDSVTKATEILNNASDQEMTQPWTMRQGEKIFMTLPKVAVMRGFVMNHVVHHRGQLSVYARLLDIPVPSIYGPSADEPDM